MILGANQPYFLPYIGYFQLIDSVDKFLLLDNFQYEKGGWINRNRILRDGNWHYITTPLQKVSYHRNINEHTIGNLDPLYRSISEAYKFAPYYNQVTHLIENVLNFPDKRLNYFLLNSLQLVCNYLGITTPLILNSERNDPTELRGEQRVIHLCKSMDADTYINSIGGQTLYNKENFAKENITLKFIKPELRPYKQVRTQEFVPALSILDVMMNVPRDEIREMLTHHSFI